MSLILTTAASKARARAHCRAVDGSAKQHRCGRQEYYETPRLPVS